MPQTFLITGATGVQGGSTARELLLKGAKIHALVRDPSSEAAKSLEALGATLFKGDFDDIPAIEKATAGVTGVFLNTFPNFTDPDAEVRYARNFVTAAKKVETVTTFVVSTVWKASEQLELLASKPEFSGPTSFLKYYYERKAGVEKVVKEGGFPNWTVLRPGWLNYNYLAPSCAIHFPEYQSERILTVSYPPAFKKSHFDPYDVGKFAAAAFLAPERFNGHVIELSGEPLTFDEIAQRLSEVSGVEVKIKYRTEEETQQLLKAGTLPVLVSQVWAVEVAPILDHDSNALDKYGIKLGTLKEYMEKEKERLLKTLGVEK